MEAGLHGDPCSGEVKGAMVRSPGPDLSVSLIIFHSIVCAISWLPGHTADAGGGPRFPGQFQF